ncbi:zinc finger BED domain-containing protein 1 [Austrofundulus limnaeus]|uniref:Zinc finger BED domain-containing protein 1 n=1 Tax=Austrofundulus limnaeus TaxID=52670 RepID=A0A2I4CY83_AUSLI|nr:PREDICTED: zinc finger BED domain-containing protein 1-like [Austrofundulus limnaeus]
METQEHEVASPPASEAETATQAAQEGLLPKRGGTSVIWLHFGFKKSDTEQKTVICKLCQKAVLSPNANTTNLFYHLKKNHEKEPIRIQEVRGKASCETSRKSFKSQSKITESLTRGTPYEKTSQRHKQITVAISHYIWKGMTPVYVVEKDSFRDLVKVLDPRYFMPSRKHFSQVELPRLYDACRTKVEKEVRSVVHYALTTDLWTSRVTQPYMSVTIHFISEDWTLCARCLQTAYFPEDHTGAMSAQGMLHMQYVCVRPKDRYIYIYKMNESYIHMAILCVSEELLCSVGLAGLVLSFLTYCSETPNQKNIYLFRSERYT